jgi:hypothetical protein
VSNFAQLFVQCVLILPQLSIDKESL